MKKVIQRDHSITVTINSVRLDNGVTNYYLKVIGFDNKSSYEMVSDNIIEIKLEAMKCVKPKGYNIKKQL